jgi:hypothetical protein
MIKQRRAGVRQRDGRRGRVLVRPWTTAEWLAWFRTNADRESVIPWEVGAEVTKAELAAVGRSLQAWQLGECSDGKHLKRVAALYAAGIGDPDYPLVIELFIREEQGHGALLGRFLDLAGVGRLTADWGDSLFRAARYGLANMETWTTPVVMVETLAMVYYNAIWRATGSRVLRTICARLLADEGPHVRFQCERLAVLRRGRSGLGRLLTSVAQHGLFLLIVLLVWVGHRQALRAGGYGWRHYWRASWDRMKAAWQRMDPDGYDWTPDLPPGREDLSRKAEPLPRPAHAAVPVCANSLRHRSRILD